jgi:hypothetical protein
MAITFVDSEVVNVTTANTDIVFTASNITGLADDDYMIFSIVHAESEDGDWTVTPGGLTSLIAEHQAGQTPPSIPGISIWAKFASSESGTYTFTTDFSSGMVGILAAYRGVLISTPQDAAATTAQSTAGGNIDAPSITTVTDGAFVLAFGFKDADTNITVPTDYTSRGLGGTGAGGNGCAYMLADDEIVSAGAEDPAAFGNASDEWGAVTMALRPIVGPTITSVDSDDDIDDKQTGVVIAGSRFEATQGTGKVEISDNAVYATGTKINQTVTAWGDTSITITVDMSTLGPGTRWVWVTNDSDERNAAGFVVALHRAQAFDMSASANIAASGEATTRQLTIPAGKVAGDFLAGRIQDDENPADSINLGVDEFTEIEWCIQANTDSREVQYDFRVTKAGVVLDTYTVTPKLTITAGFTGTGAQTLPAVTQAGVGAQVFTVTAAMTLPSLTQAGVGVLQPAATAAQTLPAVTQAGAGEQPHEATAAQTLPGVIQAGAGEQEMIAAGAQTLPGMTQAGAGEQPHEAAGAQTLPSVTQAGVGVMEADATGAQNLPAVTQAGAAGQEMNAAGAQTLPAVTQAGVGVMEADATGAQNLPAVTQAGAGGQEMIATGGQTLPVVTQAGSGAQPHEGTAAQTLPGVTQAGVGFFGDAVTGTAVQTLPAVTQAGVGVMEADATAAQTLPSVIQAGVGEQPHEGAAVQILPSVTQAGSGEQPPDGAAAQTLPAVTQVGAGIQEMIATGGQTLPAVTQAGSGAQPHEGSAAQSLPGVTQAGSGEQPHEGSAAQTLPAVVQAGSGEQPLEGTAAQTLPAVTQIGAGIQEMIATGGQTLPAVTQAGSGAQPHEGTAAQTLPGVTQAGSGAVVPVGTGAQLLPAVVQAGAGQVQANSGSQVLPAATQAGVGVEKHVGLAAQVLPGLIQSANSIVLPEGIGAQVLPALTQIGTARHEAASAPHRIVLGPAVTRESDIPIALRETKISAPRRDVAVTDPTTEN